MENTVGSLSVVHLTRIRIKKRKGRSKMSSLKVEILSVGEIKKRIPESSLRTSYGWAPLSIIPMFCVQIFADDIQTGLRLIVPSTSEKILHWTTWINYFLRIAYFSKRKRHITYSVTKHYSYKMFVTLT